MVIFVNAFFSPVGVPLRKFHSELPIRGRSHFQKGIESHSYLTFYQNYCKNSTTSYSGPSFRATYILSPLEKVLRLLGKKPMLYP